MIRFRDSEKALRGFHEDHHPQCRPGGGTLAEHLAGEANDITMVDASAELLRALGERLDIRTILGSASFPHILRQSGADNADLLVAVTNSDEVNMIACQVDYTLFNTPVRIARIRESSYLMHSKLFSEQAIPVDVLISPEQSVTDDIRRLMEYPGALQVIDFADGKVQLACVRANYGGPLVGQQIRQIRQHVPGVDVRIVVIFRRNHPAQPQGDTWWRRGTRDSSSPNAAIFVPSSASCVAVKMKISIAK